MVIVSIGASIKSRYTMPGQGAAELQILPSLFLAVITDVEEQRDCQGGEEAVKSGVVDRRLVDIEPGQTVNKVLDI